MDRADASCLDRPVLRWRMTCGGRWLDLVEERAAGDRRLFIERLNGLEVAREADAVEASRALIRRALA